MPTIIIVKKTAMPAVLSEFIRADIMPEPTPGPLGGPELIIDELFGDANMPLPQPMR